MGLGVPSSISQSPNLFWRVGFLLGVIRNCFFINLPKFSFRIIFSEGSVSSLRVPWFLCDSALRGLIIKQEDNVKVKVGVKVWTDSRVFSRTLHSIQFLLVYLGLSEGPVFPAAMISAPPLRWVLLFLFPTLSHQTSGTFSVEVQSPVSGFLGSSVSLHCALVNNLDARNLEVSWYRPKMSNTPILSYKNTEIQKSPLDVQYQGRVFLLGELERGDVSLKLENLTLADRGDYVCHVSSDNWYDKATVSLTVRVMGSTPVLSLTGAEGGQINVSCQSHGWVPEPSVTWTDKDGRDLKHLSKDKFTNSSEGVVDVSSWLIVSPSESEWISCSVGLSDQERKEGRIMLHAPPGVTESWNGYVIVILVLLLLLLLCAAGTAVYCVLRKKGRIFSKRKGTENTEGTPSEMEPLKDQNDAPPRTLNSVVVVDIEQTSEQRAKTPPTPSPDLNQQKSSEQQTPEAVKENPQVTEPREEDSGSSSFSSPGFSTAGSTTDTPNITAPTSQYKPAAPMSEMEPSASTSNPTPTTTTSNPTFTVTSSNPTPASTPSNPTPASTPSNPTPASTTSNPTPASTPLNPTPASTPLNPTPAATPSNPTPATKNSNPTPASTPLNPTPAATPLNPTPASTPSNPTPAATPSNPTPATKNSNPTPASTPFKSHTCCHPLKSHTCSHPPQIPHLLQRTQIPHLPPPP
ncbi:hypothetical protein AMELA_G00271260 [Ameiurus melas]|uniref:Ig-like domain-containing protein n=1 Tax=Ameiurus melas TaxID=219545 RepID=A0A7J5ZLD8_AMEME|nr:hypothetical protein AMELA_G00271260 [Ameiurus melas]